MPDEKTRDAIIGNNLLNISMNDSWGVYIMLLNKEKDKVVKRMLDLRSKEETMRELASQVKGMNTSIKIMEKIIEDLQEEKS